jgi:hypothetical protein
MIQHLVSVVNWLFYWPPDISLALVKEDMNRDGIQY